MVKVRLGWLKTTQTLFEICGFDSFEVRRYLAYAHNWVDGVKYPCEFLFLAPVLLLVVRQRLMNFLSRRREAVWRNNPSQGDNAASAEVATAKWQSENVGESEVGWSETLFLGNRKGVGRQIIQPPFLILPVLVWFEQRNTTYVTRIVYNESGLG